MEKMYLKTGEYVWVDSDLYDGLHTLAWRRRNGTVTRSYRSDGKTMNETLATAITGEKAGKGCVWEHIDGNWRNFTRGNLRLQSKSELINTENHFKSGDIATRTTRANPNGYTGVSKRGNRFVALASVDGKQTYLGMFKTKEEAALAYDEALVKQGLPAINFPDGYVSNQEVKEQASTLEDVLAQHGVKVTAELLSDLRRVVGG